MSDFLNNFLGGFTFGMLANNPFFRGCFGFGFGFGMYPMYGRVDFGGFANPFPSIFGNMSYSSSMAAQIPPSTFANAGFPTVDFSGACQTIWDTYTNPDSEYNKQIREYYKQMEEQSKNSNNSSQQQYIPQTQFPFSSFYMPSSVSLNPWITNYSWQYSPYKTESDKPASVEYKTYSKGESDKRFNKFLSIVAEREGGYSDRKNDRGGKTYKGVTHTTYDEYRRSKGLSTRDVREMTDDEMREIYYERYYKASGADRIADKKLALYVFDTAVNMGVERAKEFLKASNGDRNKFETLRRNKYASIIANDSSQKENENGWKNRMNAIKKAADSELDTIA